MDELYSLGRPHKQSAVERKLRALAQKGLLKALIGSHNSNIAYRVTERTQANFEASRPILKQEPFPLGQGGNTTKVVNPPEIYD